MPSFKSLSAAARTLVIVCILLVLILIFWAGMIVGRKQADFSYRWDKHYVEVFGAKDSPFGMRSMMNGGMLTNGAAGKILAINLPSIAIQDPNHIEKAVIVNASTTVRYMHSTGSITNLAVGDFVIAVGTPDAQGRIVASYINIMPPMPFTAPTSTRLQ